MPSCRIRRAAGFEPIRWGGRQPVAIRYGLGVVTLLLVVPSAIVFAAGDDATASTGVLPTLILSGFMSPIASMPTVIQWITHIVPARYFLIITRGIFLKGVGPEVLWSQMAGLALLGVASLFIASRKFRKTLA